MRSIRVGRPHTSCRAHALLTSCRAAYHRVIDALDDDKELTFALVQDCCARETRRTTRDPDRHGSARDDARRFVRPQTGTPARAGRPRQVPSTEANISTFLCNILEANDKDPKRVLKARDLPTHDMESGRAIDALFQAALPFMPSDPPASDTDASGADASLLDSHASDVSDDY
jgi:hypothetical protein